MLKTHFEQGDENSGAVKHKRSSGERSASAKGLQLKH